MKQQTYYTVYNKKTNSYMDFSVFNQTVWKKDLTPSCLCDNVQRAYREVDILTSQRICKDDELEVKPITS